MDAEAGVIDQNFVTTRFGRKRRDQGLDRVHAREIRQNNFGFDTIFVRTLRGHLRQCRAVSGNKKDIEAAGGELESQRLADA